MNVKLKTLAALIMVSALSIPAVASGNKCAAGPKDKWMSKDVITQSLTSQGYKVKKIEKEDGCYEAYVKKDGKKYEIYLNPITGAVVKTEEK
ncbi:MAG: PepSY domain-containing protein [Emcibacter sp.]|nr:PepSY domain-containing protein [Emcibacter sp.]